MRSPLRHFILFVLFLLPLFSFGQQINTTVIGCPGVPGACGSGMHINAQPQPTSALPATASVPNTPQNGNNTLGNIYSNTACGLNWTQASQRLGKRFSPAGINQPAPFVISGIPSCATIVKAYLWAEGSGNGMAQTATVNGPMGSANYPMTIVGQGPDKCWGYAGSYTYRADVTASVNGNGTYNISGILTNPPTAGNDMDGATLIVIYTDPSQTYKGTIRIDDGAMIVNTYAGTVSYTMNYPAVCGVTTGAQVFGGFGDLQLTGTTITMNGTPGAYTWNWWNLVVANTTVTSGQTSSVFTGTASTGDCFNLCIAGLYYRTTCTTCTPASLTLSATATPATCSACNGTASVTVTPAGTYTYSWNTTPAQTTATATGLCAGTYICTVTSSCGTGTVSVTVPTLGGSITVANTSSSNVLCNGQCNGSATVTASGGTAPYTFTWSPSAPNTTTGNSNTATGLCAGTYVVSTTDAAGCTGTQTVTITQPTAIAATSSATQSTCGNPNGTATVNPSGGTGPSYTYLWNTTPAQTSQTATGLVAGTYNCIITDNNGCTFSISVTVPGATSPTASLLIFNNVTCNGACDGAISISISGGTPPYSQSWSPAGGTGTTAPNLCPGVYTCTVTDANGCTATFTQTITEPPALAVTHSQTDVTCNAACNGSATVNVTGGSPSYVYAWSPSGGSGATANNLCAGNYTCDITDVNGCTISQTFLITEPTPLTVSSAGFNVTCFGACNGQVVAIPSGGTPNYTFQWNPGCANASCNNVCAGTYVVTVTDFNGCTATSTATVTEPTDITIVTSTIDAHCNQADGSASATFSGGTGTLTPVWYNPSTPGPNMNNIAAGNYFVVVTDGNGCDDTAQVTINNIPGVTATAGPVTNVSCFGGNNGSASVNVVGGTGTLTYVWSCSPSTTNSASGLTAGPCSVTVTDSAGCSSTVNYTITEPADLSVTATAAPGIICAGQTSSLTATGAGGTIPYSYGWMPGPMVGPTQTVSPVTTTTYTVYISDANQCTDSATVAVTVNPNPVAALSGDSLAGCIPLHVQFTDNSTVSAGNIVQWAWDFGDGFTSTLQNPTHYYTVAGYYTVVLTVTTASGCSNTVTMTNYIDVYPTPIADFSANPQPTTELNPTIYFTDQSIGANSWTWSFGDFAIPPSSSTLQNPSFTYPGAGCFDVLLTVSSSNGCIDTTMHQVCIDPDVSIYVPNAFSPDGDGVNDLFFPKGLGLDPDHFEMWIFDRWGNLIYYSQDLYGGWDGTVQGHEALSQNDVYVWKIKVSDLKGNKHSFVGHVSMIK